MTDSHNDDRDDVIEAVKSNPIDDTEDYEVGYGRPPKKHQFAKGRSGNPKGRAKGARGLRTDLEAEIMSRVPVTENGKTKKLTKQQLVLKAMVAKAAKGDTKAAAQVITLIIQMLGIEDKRTGRTDLSPADLAIMESYLAGDVGNFGLPDPSALAPDEGSEPQTDAAGNGNHNNLNTTTVPDEESDDEPSC